MAVHRNYAGGRRVVYLQQLIHVEISEGFPYSAFPMPKDSTPQPVQNLLAIEELIKGYLADIQAIKEKLKAHKEMVKGAIEQDKDYSLVAEKQNAAKKEVAKVKETLVKTPAITTAQLKVNELQTELKDAQNALSDYLNQYIQLTQTSEFVGPDGEVLQIVRSAKLVKQKK